MKKGSQVTSISIPPTSDHSPNNRKPSKTREVGSRFLSPTSSIESGRSSPETSSPILKKPPTVTDARKHRSSSSEEKETGGLRGLWPKSKKAGTLADHLGNDRLKDFINSKPIPNNGPHSLTKQRSCSEFNRFEKTKESSKENHRPFFGGSMRYTGKLRFPGGKSSSSSSKSSVVSGKLSVDENNLSRRRKSDSFAESSEGSEFGRAYLASTASSRRLTAGIEVSSRYLPDSITKSRRAPSTTRSGSNSPDNNSDSYNNLPPKNGMRRADSLTAYKSTVSQWALSPGRTGSPPMSVENIGKPVVSFSSFRPPHTSSRSKGVGNLFSMGLDLFKTKKSSPPSNCLSPVGHGVGESTHHLRMAHNRLIQWRFVNARTNAVNATKVTQAEGVLLNACTSLSDLHSSVAQKRIQFEKEKRELKLNQVLQSQIEPLGAWGDMERQHMSLLSTTKDTLHSAICRVPLVEGAKVDPKPTSATLRHAVDLTSSIETIITDFSDTAQKEAKLLVELAEVVATEKSLLEECFGLIGVFSSLEAHEKSLQCSIIQLKAQQKQQDYYQSRQQPQGIST